MRLLLFERPHHLGKLHAELLAAIPSLGPVDGRAVMTIAGDGQTLRLGVPDDFNDALLAPVLTSHDPTPPPPPIVYTGSQSIDRRLRTTTAAVTEIYRATLATLTLYRAQLELLGVDAGNGNARYMRAYVVAKRLSSGALLVGAPAIVANVQDAGASTWAIAANVSGNDFVITVAGQAARTIDWHLSGSIVSFTPGGEP